MVDMSYFIIILMVFVMAYGIALQAILYPNSALNLSLIGDIFKKAYFQIYGELFLDELEGLLHLFFWNIVAGLQRWIV